MADLNPDSLTETTTTGWLSRMGSSLVGMLIGIILVPAAICFLYWNEGRAVTDAAGLKSGLSEIVEVSADTVNPQNNSKLVYLTNTMTGATPAADPWSNLSVNGVLRLRRIVEMYLWSEKESEMTMSNVGGSQTTQKTYTYSLGWSEYPANSANFKVPTGHQNPAMPLESQTFDANPIKIGAFTLDKNLVPRLTDFNSVVVPKQVPAGYRVQGRMLYKGINADQPELGDVRVTYRAIAAQPYSIAAQQNSNILTTYYDKKNNYMIALIEPGVISAQKLFANKASDENRFTWVNRFIGFVMLVSGFAMIMGPLVTLVAFLPVLETLVGVGTFFIALSLSIPMTLATIAVAWLTNRPLIGCGLLIAAAAAARAFSNMAVKRKAAAAIRQHKT